MKVASFDPAVREHRRPVVPADAALHQSGDPVNSPMPTIVHKNAYPI